jgi:S-methylmethionine-dependent homocysteine/selenocysteine methylase
MYIRINVFQTAIGINCSSPLHITELLECAQVDNVKAKPLVVYPNSGEIYNPENKMYVYIFEESKKTAASQTTGIQTTDSKATPRSS